MNLRTTKVEEYEGKIKSFTMAYGLLCRLYFSGFCFFFFQIFIVPYFCFLWSLVATVADDEDLIQMGVKG